MGEVSRHLIASPRLRLMETFFLILLSSLMGIDAPYLLIYINIIILFSIIIHQMIVVVLCGHSGNHLHGCSSINLLFQWVTVLLISDRMQKIHLLSLYCFSFLFQLCITYTVQYHLCTMHIVLFIKLCTAGTILF